MVQALAKGDRGELAVETMTEVGVDEIVPWRASRCVARWEGERGAKSLGRWRATAREAAKQSRRPWLPVVTEPATTAQVAERLAGAALAVVLHEEAVAPIAQVPVPRVGEIVVVVGPEGGIAPDELAAFAERGRAGSQARTDCAADLHGRGGRCWRAAGRQRPMGSRRRLTATLARPAPLAREVCVSTARQRGRCSWPNNGTPI